MASCVGYTLTKNYKNLLIFVQVRIKNVRDVFWDTVHIVNDDDEDDDVRRVQTWRSVRRSDLRNFWVTSATRWWCLERTADWRSATSVILSQTSRGSSTDTNSANQTRTTLQPATTRCDDHFCMFSRLSRLDKASLPSVRPFTESFFVVGFPIWMKSVIHYVGMLGHACYTTVYM